MSSPPPLPDRTTRASTPSPPTHRPLPQTPNTTTTTPNTADRPTARPTRHLVAAYVAGSPGFRDVQDRVIEGRASEQTIDYYWACVQELRGREVRRVLEEEAALRERERGLATMSGGVGGQQQQQRSWGKMDRRYHEVYLPGMAKKAAERAKDEGDEDEDCDPGEPDEDEDGEERGSGVAGSWVRDEQGQLVKSDDERVKESEQRGLERDERIEQRERDRRRELAGQAVLGIREMTARRRESLSGLSEDGEIFEDAGESIERDDHDEVLDEAAIIAERDEEDQVEHEEDGDVVMRD